MKFYGALELIAGRNAAVLTLFTESGEWAGSCRVEAYDLYEEAYRQASARAHHKGGRLERFSIVPGPSVNV